MWAIQDARREDDAIIKLGKDKGWSYLRTCSTVCILELLGKRNLSSSQTAQVRGSFEDNAEVQGRWRSSRWAERKWWGAVKRWYTIGYGTTMLDSHKAEESCGFTFHSGLKFICPKDTWAADTEPPRSEEPSSWEGSLQLNFQIIQDVHASVTKEP